MTVSSLITALAIGGVLGVCGRWIVPSGRGIPFWLPLAVSICAAMLGTVVGRLAGIDTSGVTPAEIALQAVFAASAITLVAATADHRTREDRYDLDRSR